MITAYFVEEGTLGYLSTKTTLHLRRKEAEGYMVRRKDELTEDTERTAFGVERATWSVFGSPRRGCVYAVPYGERMSTATPGCYAITVEKVDLTEKEYDEWLESGMMSPEIKEAVSTLAKRPPMFSDGGWSECAECHTKVARGNEKLLCNPLIHEKWCRWKRLVLALGYDKY